MDIRGMRALVTGATGGIGTAIARRLHAGGATVLVSGRRGDLLAQLRDELGERVEVIEADLSQREAVAALPGRCGQVDLLVANAALPASGHLLSFEPDQIDRAIDVNLRAPVQLSRALAPAMAERGYGHLVFISSLSGKIGAPGSSLYSATKFGLRGFALGLREDLAASGVGVTTVFPGFIRDAGMFHDSGAKLPFYVATRTPDHVAKAVVRGVERDRLEIDVAPFSARASAAFAGVAPATVARIQRRLGGQRLSAEIARGQTAKR